MPPPERGLQATAPLRGVFPLDHDGECKSSMKEYLSCIRVENSAHARCRALSKAYLACRMQRGLMESEDLGHFGMDDTGIKQGLSSAAAAASGAAAAAGASAAAAGGGDGAANTSPQPTKFVSRRKRARRPPKEIIAGVDAAKNRKAKGIFGL